MKPNARCAVVIPCFNAEPYLESAVASVVNQTFSDYHLVIVDDASTDGTLKLAESLSALHANISVLSLKQNQGRCSARNLGVKAVDSPFVAFLDQDDSYHPDFLKTTTDLLKKHTEIDAVRVQPKISIEIDPVRYNALLGTLATIMLIRRHVFEFIGGWPESEIFRQLPMGGEDIALVKLLTDCFQIGTINTKLYNFNHRPGNSLDWFLRRTEVQNATIIFRDGLEQDKIITSELERLLNIQRKRVRDILIKQLPSHSTSTIEGSMPRK